MTVKAKREHKDSLFKIVFGENKKNALELYNAISGTNHTNADDIIMTTIEDAVYIGIKNDVAFLFDNVMNLFEHQSDLNFNMPLRGLGYFSILYSNYVDSLEGGHRNLFKRNAIQIPVPKYYVFYNGEEGQPEKITLKLSDAYEGAGDLEVVAHMLNINYNKNRKLMEACRPLAEYSTFVGTVRHYKSIGYAYSAAVEMALEVCLENGILTDVLQKEKNRVISSMLREFTEEEKELLYQERGYERGFEKGEAAGFEKGEAAGFEQGEAQGIKNSTARLTALVSRLMEEERLDDVKKAMADEEYREKLLEEFGL